MNQSEDRLWSAYLDGELTASEAADFDKNLSQSARRRLAGELKLENAIGDALRSGPGCPNALWQDLRHRLTAKPAASAALARVWLPRLAVAAVLALGLAYATDRYLNYVPEFLRPAHSLSGDPVNPVATDEEQLPTLLAMNGLEVGVKPLTSLQGHIGKRGHLRGARNVEYRDGSVVQLLYECCGQPVTIVIARSGTSAASAIERAAVRHKVAAVRTVGNAVAAVVGSHGGGGHIIEILTDESGHV